MQQPCCAWNSRLPASHMHVSCSRRAANLGPSKEACAGTWSGASSSASSMTSTSGSSQSCWAPLALARRACFSVATAFLAETAQASSTFMLPLLQKVHPAQPRFRAGIRDLVGRDMGAVQCHCVCLYTQISRQPSTSGQCAAPALRWPGPGFEILAVSCVAVGCL